MAETHPHKERKHKRVTTREVTATVEVAKGALVYTVQNLSIGGALVTGTPPLARGETYQLELKLKGTRAVFLRGTVVHVRAEGMGIAFQNVGPDEVTALEKLISTGESKNALPPPLPLNRIRTDEIPVSVPRPDDAFFFKNDPRPPRGGSPDERAEYLRQLVKNRDEAIEKGRAALAAIAAEADALRAHAAKVKAKADTVASQHQLTEVALASARAELEQERAEHLRERETSNDQIEQEQRRTLEAIAAVSGLEASMRRHEMEAKRALEEAQTARRDAEGALNDASNVRRAREELMQANRKAMETQTALSKEKAARTAAEQELEKAKAAADQASEELMRVTADLAEAQAGAGVAAENLKLKEEVARLKAKLVNAEAALEKMMSRGAAKARTTAK
jgi:hypothetical protein